MAFYKTASAKIFTPRTDLDSWGRLQKAYSKSAARVKNNPITSIDPGKYLLTHATIISSVDTEEATNVRVGASPILENGREIVRPWGDYLITPSTSKYVNANGDCWERSLLLATYKTFVGSENYLEHVQIPELSKGKIIDAVARNLEDTVYIDILVATDRVHTELIQDILSKKINAMSMGCTIQYSICSKCGNKAHDETELCDHIRYAKQTSFYDGEQRIIAELCGHYTDPDSVRFIEASWVDQPAFEGAVARNILNGSFEEFKASEQNLEDVLRRAYRITSQQAPSLGISTSPMDMFFKAASRDLTQVLTPSIQPKVSFDMGEEEEGTEEKADSPAFLEKVRKDTVKDLKDQIRRQVQKELNDEMLPKEEAKPAMPEAEAAPNDSIIQSSLKKKIVRSELERIAYAYTLKTASEHPDKIRVHKVLTASLIALKEKGHCRDLFAKAPPAWRPFIVEAVKIRDTIKMGKPLSLDYTVLAKISSEAPNQKNLIKILKASLGRTPTLKEVEFYQRRLSLLIPF